MTGDIKASDIFVRDVVAADEAAIQALLLDVYPSDMEARLVHKLRHCGALVLEQVAVAPDGSVLGHVAYSRVTNTTIGRNQASQIACLAPVSVLPGVQRQGVGSKIIETSLKRLAEQQEDLVLVLGPPSYFSKFGFDPQLAKKVRGPYVGAAFMAAPLTDAGARHLPVDVAFATPFEDFE